MTQDTPKIAVVTGPTATGKTALGVLLARELDGEIVSADSMQVYKGMNIGTAKVSPKEMQGIPHHMLDVAEPFENYSLARYVKEADACVQDILDRGKLPILVGGTGLYIDSLVAGRVFDEAASDLKLRAELEARYEARGGEALLQELAQVDPQRAAKLHPADRKRLLRALEVFYLTGQTISAHDAESRRVPAKYDAMCLALSFRDRKHLYARIDSRVDTMEKAGLFEEVSALLASGVPENCTAMQAIGYKETARALRGEISRQEALDLVRRESRRYAKRQLTWLRRKERLCWILWEQTPDLKLARQLSTEFFQSCGLK